MRRPLSLLTVAVIAATGLTAFSSAPVQTQPETPPGEGVICAWAIYGFLAEVAERCPTEVPPEVKSELRRSVDRLDAYVQANSDITPELMARFKREQSRVGVPEAQLCNLGDTAGMIANAATVSVDELRTSIDTLTARPGTPTWGTCL